MEKVAKEYILQNIGEYINDKRGLIKKIKGPAYEKGNNITLKDFITAYDVELLDIYKTKGNLRGKSINNSFYRLCVEAGIRDNFECKDETILANSLGKVTFINSIKMLKLLIEVMENLDKYKNHNFNEAEEKLLLMFHYTLYGNSLKEFNMKTAFESIIRISDNKEIFEEVLEILKYNYNNLSVVAKEDRAMENSPLEVHCTYTTYQILVALGKHTEDKKYNFQEGVLHVKEKDLDAFFITLNKVEKHYLPLTMYKDYAISSELFHW